MLSRVADSIFWMSRYIERAENIARFVDATMTLTLDLPADDTAAWVELVASVGDPVDFAARYGTPTPAAVLRYLTFDEQNSNSILTTLARARENARCVRDTISSEMWEQANRFYLDVKSAATQGRFGAMPHAFFTQVKMSSHLFVGVTDSTMSHGEAWHFNRIGRLLERADKTACILGVERFNATTLAGSSLIDDLHWSGLLKAASAHEMYRKRFGRIEPRRVFEFLLLSREFPRAAHYCLLRCVESVHAISGTLPGTYTNLPEQRLGRLAAQLDYAGVEDILPPESPHDARPFLNRFRHDLYAAGDAIAVAFFPS